MAGLGAGADIVSGFELELALRAGFPPERIVFAGVGKTEAEIDLGIELGIGDFNAESEAELLRISAAAARRGRTARVALRVNPDIDPRSHPYISTGLRENKFGTDIALAPEILARARSLVALSRRLLDQGFALETIDIGGGLGVDYDGSGGPDASSLAARVLPEL